MTDIGSSILVASMIVGMLTVPAASETIQSSNSVSADIPNISGSDSVPEEVSTNSSADSFSRKVETAFQEFRTTVTSSSVTTSVESADSRLRIQKTPSETRWVLESSTGSLVVTRSSSRTVEKVETPYGSLKTVEENGAVRESFKGSDRQKVESVAEDLRQLMKDRKKQIEQQRKQTVSDQYSQGIEIESVDGSADYVVIESSMSRTVDLEGWKLTDNAGEYEFGSAEIPPGGTLYVYTSEEDELEVDEEEDASYVYNSGLAWNQDHDTATLWRNGEEVAEKSY